MEAYWGSPTKKRPPFSSTGVLLDRMFTKCIIIEKSKGLSSCKIVSATWNSTFNVHINQTHSWDAYLQTCKDMYMSKQKHNKKKRTRGNENLQKMDIKES